MTLARGALALSALLLTPDASAWCRTTWPHAPPGLCEYGTPVSWAVGCLGVQLNTRDLRAPDDAGQDLDGVIRAALARSLVLWSDASCGRSRLPSLQLTDAGDLDAPLDLALDGRNVVSVNRRWLPDAYHRPGTIAFTVVSTEVRSGSLLEADIELNARSIENPLGREWAQGEPRWGVVDAPSVLLHEVGHLVGLWHSLEPGAVMEASMDVERQRRELTPDDRAGVCAVYPDGPPRPRAPTCRPERPAPRPLVRASGGCRAIVGTAPDPAPGALATAIATLCLAARHRRRRGALARCEPRGARRI